MPMSPVYRAPFTQAEVLLLFMYVLVFLIGTVGNGVVIKIFYDNRDQPGSRCVLMLAIVDCISSIWIPVTMIGQIVSKISDYLDAWPFGKVMCYLRPFMLSLLAASAWLLVAICLERIR